MMTPSDFQRSVSGNEPLGGLLPALTALWWAAKDNWDRAHAVVMNERDRDCAWVHAYLHRLEGDHDNARYWYRQARRKPAEADLAAEWAAIVSALLASGGG